MVGNYRPFGDHLPTNDIKKFWSIFDRNLVGNYRPFGNHLPTNDIKNFGRFLVAIWSVITDHLETIYRPNSFDRKIVGNGLSVNGR